MEKEIKEKNNENGKKIRLEGRKEMVEREN